MTSLTYFNQEKRKIQETINDIVDQLNALKKVNVEDAESVQTLIEDITVAGQKLSEEQFKFRNLVFEHYSAVPDEAADIPDFTSDPEEDNVYEPELQQQEGHSQAQQQIVQNVITGVTALLGAYGIFKSIKR